MGVVKGGSGRRGVLRGGVGQGRDNGGVHTHVFGGYSVCPVVWNLGREGGARGGVAPSVQGGLRRVVVEIVVVEGEVKAERTVCRKIGIEDRLLNSDLKRPVGRISRNSGGDASQHLSGVFARAAVYVLPVVRVYHQLDVRCRGSAAIHEWRRAVVVAWVNIELHAIVDPVGARRVCEDDMVIVAADEELQIVGVRPAVDFCRMIVWTRRKGAAAPISGVVQRVPIEPSDCVISGQVEARSCLRREIRQMPIRGGAIYGYGSGGHHVQRDRCSG